MKEEKIRFVIDEGNSLVKIAAYRGDEWIFFEQRERVSDDFLGQCLQYCPTECTDNCTKANDSVLRTRFLATLGMTKRTLREGDGRGGSVAAAPAVPPYNPSRVIPNGAKRNEESGTLRKHGAKRYNLPYLCPTQEKPQAIFISTRQKDAQSHEQLSRFFDVMLFDHHTPVPVNNLYETPATLGLDRLASVVGAAALFEKSDVLVIDAGTCITYDFIDVQKSYHGGGIMPGLQMKLQALHTFTGNLPLVSLDTAEKLCGRNTEEAILAGAINVTLLGLDALITCFKQQHTGLKTVLCGGNAEMMQKSLKNDTFAEPKLTLYGLKQILDFNEDS